MQPAIKSLFEFRLGTAGASTLSLGKRFDPEMTSNRKFSVSWCVGIFLVHAVFTLILGLLIFASGMASFTHGPGFFFYAGKVLMWVWSPFAMLANDQNHRLGIPAEAAAFLWSLVVGFVAGFVAARFRKPDSQDASSPPANPDLAGTPWAKDSHFTFGPAHQSKIKKMQNKS